MTEHVTIEPSRIKGHSVKDYAIRFGFGGLITLITGILAKAFGPGVGGLFLAFPAILPASLTLIEEDENKEKAGLDARGAVFGCVGLAAFGLVVWLLTHSLGAVVLLTAALAVWTLVSVAVWWGYGRLSA